MTADRITTQNGSVTKSYCSLLLGTMLLLSLHFIYGVGLCHGQDRQPNRVDSPVGRSEAPWHPAVAASGNVQSYQKIYRPRHSKADDLLLRYLAILPFELRQQTRTQVFPEENSFILSGPQRAIAIADEMIPRMDDNVQLKEGYVDVGVVPGNTSRPVRQLSGIASAGTGSLLAKGRHSASSTQSSGSGQVPKVEQYYDPNENRTVRVAMQAENAILPEGPRATNLSSFGGQSVTAGTDRGKHIDSRTLDIVVYRCPSEQTVDMVNKLRLQYAKNPEVVVASDVGSGRIFVHTTRELHRGIQQYFGAMGVFPESPALEQYDPRIQEGTVYRITGQSGENRGGDEDGQPSLHSFSPKIKRVQDLEKLVQALFGNRLVAIDQPNTAGQESLTRQNPPKTSYRFTKRKTTGDTIVRSCDLQFDFLNQKVLVAGDRQLCGQMEQLLVAMDRHAPSQGNVRRFISLRQSDPKKVREILDIYYSSPRAKFPGTKNNSRATIPIASSVPKHEANGLVSPIRSVFAMDGNSTSSIQSTAWQGEGGTNTGGGLESFATGQGGEARGVGIVQDYLPQVLPDLDVVIIDAPEAEYKRIENMIREIEELAKLADPKIEIYNLKHVNCVMLQGTLQLLHQEMFVTKQGRVVIFAMQNPNAILVVGWGQAFISMKDLINVFDQPIADGADLIRVIRLKYASARDMAIQLTTYFPYPQSGTGGFSPRIRVFPDIRTNSLVIHAAPNDLIRIQQILSELDVNKSAPRLRVRTFALKNLLAADLRQTLMNAIIPSVQGTQESGAAKFPILEILSVDAESKRLIESGIMTDVNIVADPNNNQLIVTAPEDCMELIEKLIAILDIAPAKAQMKIFRIVYGDATQMTRTLQSLLPTGGGHMPAVPNADGEDSFVPVRFATDTRTNCVIATASPKDLKIVEALILSLDRKDTMERTEVVVPLRNVQALSIAKAIDDYLSRKQNLEIASEAMSVYQMFESQVIVVPESITNSLIISATPRYLEEIKKLVESFDNDPPQVVIQVLIAEVTLTDHEEFGIEAGLQDTVAFDRSVIKSVTDGVNSATGIPGFDMLGTNNQGNNMSSHANSSFVAGQLLNTLGVGRTSSDADFGGLVVSASSRNVQVTLRALKEKNRLQILSRPQITAMDNQQAFILVGQRVPRVDKANMTNYGITSSVTDANVGLILLVTPRISKEGRVIMEIGAEKSSLAGSDDAIPVFSSGDQIIKSPSINTIQAMTAVSAMDGETVMLGGLITSSREKRSRGVPWLSDIPHIGWLFRYDKEHEERKELLIVMTPRVVHDISDLENIKRIEASKMNWCLADAMAINGNMGLHDPLTGQSASRKKTMSLPFMEMQKMEMKDSPSVHSLEKDSPLPKTDGMKSRPTRPEGVLPKRVPQSGETLPNDIYRPSMDGITVPQASISKGLPGVNRSGVSSPITIPPFPGTAPVNMAENRKASGVATHTPPRAGPGDEVDLDKLARNGYAFSPRLNTGQPIRAAGYEEERSSSEKSKTDNSDKPIPMGMNYSQAPRYR